MGSARGGGDAGDREHCPLAASRACSFVELSVIRAGPLDGLDQLAATG